MMLEGYTVVGVQFLDDKKVNNSPVYYYYALYDDMIGCGDIVAVHTGHHGISLAQIVEYAPANVPADAVKYGREVISRVDFTAYRARQQKLKQLKELKSRMDAKVKDLQQTAVYEMLAERDPELRAMLEIYKGLMQ